MASVVQAMPAIRLNDEKETLIKNTLLSESKKMSTAFGYKR